MVPSVWEGDMMYAVVGTNGGILATPGARGHCPNCHQVVIARCGEINVWHWAHEAREFCDDWAEPDTDWHYFWKRLMPADQVEVSIERNGERHSADIQRKDGTVIELHASYISPEEIRAREAFFGSKLLWLFDSRDAVAETDNGPRLELREKGSIYTFRWKHPKKHTGFTTRAALLDLGEVGIFRLRKLHLDGGAPYGGWGVLYSRESFIEWLRSSHGEQPPTELTSVPF